MAANTNSKPPATSALRDARRRANLPAELLAERAGVTVGWLRTIERAPGLMSPALAARIAAALGVDPRDLAGEAPPAAAALASTRRPR